jgi:hypothetical protein
MGGLLFCNRRIVTTRPSSEIVNEPPKVMCTASRELSSDVTDGVPREKHGRQAHLARLERHLKESGSTRFYLGSTLWRARPMFLQDVGVLMALVVGLSRWRVADAVLQRHHDLGKTLMLPLSSYLASFPK